MNWMVIFLQIAQAYATRPKRKRPLAQMTIEQKYLILMEVENGARSKAQIARGYNIPMSTLSTWVKNACNIKAAYQHFGPQRKRIRVANEEELDKSLLKWYYAMMADGLRPVTGPMLFYRANELVKELKITNFRCNMGWMERFKKRHNISFRGQTSGSNSWTLNGTHSEIWNHGEVQCSVTTPEALRNWKTKSVPALLEEYSLDDIYSVAEVGLLFSVLPDQNLFTKGDGHLRRKSSKERVTVLVCSNATGTDKRPLLVVGGASGPDYASDPFTLPILYKTNPQAWMSKAIFSDWMYALDLELRSLGRKAVLLTDDIPVHQDISKLGAMNIVYIPVHSKSKTLPMDLGITQQLKFQYRKRILSHTLAAIESGEKANITLSDAVQYLQQAWSCISPAQIMYSFSLSGFQFPADYHPDGQDPFYEAGMDDMLEELSKNGLRLQGSFMDFVGCDNHLTTSESPLLNNIHPDAFLDGQSQNSCQGRQPDGVTFSSPCSSCGNDMKSHATGASEDTAEDSLVRETASNSILQESKLHSQLGGVSLNSTQDEVKSESMEPAVEACPYSVVVGSLIPTQDIFDCSSEEQSGSKLALLEARSESPVPTASEALVMCQKLKKHLEMHPNSRRCLKQILAIEKFLIDNISASESQLRSSESSDSR